MEHATGLAGPFKQKGPGLLGFMEKIAPFVPIVGGIAKNILGGINERKSRLYNSPAEQVKRLNEAGLPKAAASNLSPGGGVAVTSDLGTDQYNQNLSSSITRQIDRKKLEILQQEERIQKAKADIDEGNARNMLNPQGVFENTNQGVGAMQTLVQQSEAIKGAQIVNKWMPTEKFQNVMKQGKEIESISANIQNSLAQNKILIEEGKIKNIIANYQERMSMHELTNLIRRNTGIKYENKLKEIAINVEYNTMLDKIKLARNAATSSDNAIEAQKLSLILSNLSLPSTKAYYEIRRMADKEHMENPNLVKTLIYLGLFQPTTSNYNLSQLGSMIPGIPNISGDKHFNTHNYISK